MGSDTVKQERLAIANCLKIEWDKIYAPSDRYVQGRPRPTPTMTEQELVASGYVGVYLK